MRVASRTHGKRAGMGNQLPVIKPEEQEVWAEILYRECREAGVTIELNDLREFCKRIWKVSPWLKHTGISRERWGAVGEQMTAYEQQYPGELEDLDFLIFGVIKSLLEGPERPGRDWNESGSGERGGENPGKQKIKECREKIGLELHLADGKGEAGEHPRPRDSPRSEHTYCYLTGTVFRCKLCGRRV